MLIGLENNYIKRLKDIGSMRREAKGNDLVFKVEIKEFEGIVGAVSIKDKEALSPYPLAPYFLLEVPQLVYAKHIIRIA